MVSFTKFDDSGNFLWTKKNILENNPDITYLQTKFDGESDCTFMYDYHYILKFDSSGEFSWCKKLIDSTSVSIKDILPLQNGDLFIIGDRFPSGHYCMFLDNTGHIFWQGLIGQLSYLNFINCDYSRNVVRIFGRNYPEMSIYELDTSLSTLISYSFTDPLFGNGSHSLNFAIPLPENSFLLYIDTFYVVIDSAFQTKTILDAGNSREIWHGTSGDYPYYAFFINNKIVDIYSHYYDDWWMSFSTSSFTIRELNLGGGECVTAEPFIHQLVPAQLTLSPCNIYDSSVFHLGTFDSVTFDSLVSDTSTLITCLFDNIESSPPLQFDLYPNPASSILNIKCMDNSDFELEIYNAIGNCTYKSNFRNQTSINCSDFSSGIYFVKVFNEEQAGAKKFLVEK